MLDQAGRHVTNVLGKSDFRLVDRARQAFVELLRADTFACEFGLQAWEFAIKLTELEPYGLKTNDVRWLVCKGFLQCADALNEAQDGCQLVPVVGLQFSPKTSCILTDAGVQFVRRALAMGSPSNAKPNSDTDFMMDVQGDTAHSLDIPTDLVEFPKGCALSNLNWPEWNDLRRELCMAGTVVKRFRVPAPNQETILQVFEEENWPERIDDPLPQTTSPEPKRRLHDTINALNRNQKSPLIRFYGDGRGEGVCWEAPLCREIEA